MRKRISSTYNNETIYFNRAPSRGTYFVLVTNAETNKILETQKILVNY